MKGERGVGGKLECETVCLTRFRIYRNADVIWNIVVEEITAERFEISCILNKNADMTISHSSSRSRRQTMRYSSLNNQPWNLFSFQRGKARE